MDVIFERVAGLDVHKRKVTACRLIGVGAGWVSEINGFETNTAALLDLSDWLEEAGNTHVGMESTGEY